MKRRAPKRPTDAELEILGILWDRGPSTVREVHEDLIRAKPVIYTTVLKLMQIMAEKGWVLRDERQRTHIYRPAVPRQQTQRQLVVDLIDRAFGGSARALVLQALAARKSTPEELKRIQQLIDDFARGVGPEAQPPTESSEGGNS